MMKMYKVDIQEPSSTEISNKYFDLSMRQDFTHLRSGQKTDVCDEV